MRGGWGSRWRHRRSGRCWPRPRLGALVDRIRWKRLAVAVAAAVVAAGCVLLYLVPTMLVVVAAQTAIGAAAAIFPPAVAAITLGLVGRAVMPRQTGRNEAYNHGGNVVAAALAGACAYFLGYGAMFFLVAAMAAASAGAVMLIRERGNRPRTGPRSRRRRGRRP